MLDPRPNPLPDQAPPTGQSPGKDRQPSVYGCDAEAFRDGSPGAPTVGGLMVPVLEAVLLLDQQGRIIRAGTDHAGARLSELQFPIGATLHSVLHPDCDGMHCKLAVDWSRAWRSHQGGMAVHWNFHDRVRNWRFNIRLQPVNYACSAIYGDAINEYQSCSVAFVQDITAMDRIERPTAYLAYGPEFTTARPRVSGEQTSTACPALSTTTAQLLIAQEAERKRIAAELHDSLGQTLSVLRFEVEAHMARARTNGWNAPFLERSTEYVKRSLEELREIVSNLRPGILNKLGLTGSLELLCADFQAQCPNVQVDCELTRTACQLPSELATAIYRITQEALNNVARHAEAERVLIILAMPAGNVELVVHDDGVGLPAANQGRDGLGLITMRERTETLGGSFRVANVRSQGCSVHAHWPRAAVEQLRQ